MTAYTFDQIIDYTRTSAATYVANTGFVTQTPASRNLLTYTQEFDNAAWSKLNATVTANGTTAPDGTMTADTVVASAGSAQHNVQQGGGGSGSPLTLSAYAKAGTSSFLQFSHGAGATIFANFNLATGALGTVGAGATAAIDSIGNGWYRCAMTFTPGSAFNSAIAVAPSATSPYREVWTATGTESILIWGAQLEAVPDANLVLGSELVSNGDFASGSTGWTVGAGNLTVVSGRGRLENTSATASYAVAAITTVVGRAYRLNMEAFAGTTTGNYRVGTSSNGEQLIATVSVSGNVPRTFVATTTTTYVTIRTASAVSGEYCEFDNITVKEITGTTGMPTTYTRNVGGVYPPRFDYDPVTLAPRGLLIEEQRTNLLTYSEQFDNAAWVKQGATATANTTTSPDGTADADTLVEDTSAGVVHRVYATPACSPSTTYTFTAYVKAAGRTEVRLLETTLGGAIFNLSTAAIVSTDAGVTASIQDAGNGWRRCRITATTGGAQTLYVAQIQGSVAGSPNYTGNGAAALYLWGAQLEAGAFATSYIPTVASQVTRTADQATVTGANFSRWYNQSEGTFVAEADSFASVDTSVRWAVSASDSPANSRNTVFLYNGKWGASARISGTDQCDLQQTGSYTPNTAAKIAFAYKANDFAASVNGLVALTDNSGSIPSVDRLFVGSFGATNAINGHIRRIRYYPTRLSNTQLQALTA